MVLALPWKCWTRQRIDGAARWIRGLDQHGKGLPEMAPQPQCKRNLRTVLHMQ